MIETLGQTAVGGALIGLALATLMILIGREMSASKLIGNLLVRREGPAAISIAFLAGLLISPTILLALGYAEQAPIEAAWPLLVVGGVFVGVGSRLADSSLFGAIGGLARRSGRALATTLAIFVGAAVSLIVVDVFGTVGVG